MDGWKESLYLSFWGWTIFAFRMLVDKILDVCMICQTDFEFGMGLPRIASSEAIVKIFGRKINGEN